MKQEPGEKSKKYIILPMVLTVLLLLLGVPAQPAGAQGEIVGEAVNTDIAAYIDGLPIPSYNINGYTGIVAEDLAAYGFTVVWDGTERTLSVWHTPESVPVTADYVPEANTMPIGPHAADIYATDITVFVEGSGVPAFNIGGRTIIFMDELNGCGRVDWRPQEREICFTRHVHTWENLGPEILMDWSGAGQMDGGYTSNCEHAANINICRNCGYFYGQDEELLIERYWRHSEESPGCGAYTLVPVTAVYDLYECSGCGDYKRGEFAYYHYPTFPGGNLEMDPVYVCLTQDQIEELGLETFR